MDRLSVHLNGTPIYDIVLNQSFQALPEEVKKLGTEKKKICIVTDSNVAPLYLEEVKKQLAGTCREVDEFIFPAGEEYKNLNTVRDLYETLIRKAYDRKDMLAALGGGVVGDLCGFAAATYLRGISFIQIPTTLLSQVDSSIGGKTGVDFDAYKNMVGAFHMPGLVYTNVKTLSTLSPVQFASGMGEVIKHGLIKDSSYYHWLEVNAPLIKGLDYSLCQQMILTSNCIKRDVVEQDPTEKGDRALLNFGHTLGHAIEKLMNFSMPHGHCVAAGSLAACAIAAKKGFLEWDELTGLRNVLKQYHLPFTISGIRAEDILEAVKHDKKMNAGIIKFILLRKIGDAYVDISVSQEDMLSGLSYILQ